MTVGRCCEVAQQARKRKGAREEREEGVVLEELSAGLGEKPGQIGEEVTQRLPAGDDDAGFQAVQRDAPFEEGGRRML